MLSKAVRQLATKPAVRTISTNSKVREALKKAGDKVCKLVEKATEKLPDDKSAFINGLVPPTALGVGLGAYFLRHSPSPAGTALASLSFLTGIVGGVGAGTLNTARKVIAGKPVNPRDLACAGTVIVVSGAGLYAKHHHKKSKKKKLHQSEQHHGRSNKF